ncbi:MAG: S-adenosylmethionine:tRNA ribosyltransferase-isomerase, partial [Planctomycetes bacterium]|nr:S-adenosylmethionine:tRNA ribosyltransferase-isomerase [Planctomycetota bacterium]
MNENDLSLYDFNLPEELVAQRPAATRDASRLMLLEDGNPPAHRMFSDFPDILRAGDVLVRNDTRVIPARLRCKRAGGGKMELLLIHHLTPAEDGDRWLCLARPSAHLKPGKTVSFGDGKHVALCEERKGEGKVIVKFPDCNPAELMAL